MTRRQILAALIRRVYQSVPGYELTDSDMDGMVAAAKLFFTLAETQRQNVRIYINDFVQEFAASFDGAAGCSVEAMREAG